VTAVREFAGKGRRVLFLSYDGMTDPLGQSQVIPYLAGLARRGFAIHLISFEKPERSREHGEAIRRLLDADGIRWHPLPYTKWPPVLSTVWDVARLRRAARRLHAREKFDLVHCRSYIPAIVGLELKRAFGVRFLFDMRGFWADEKVDAGSWPQRKRLYRAVYDYFKRKEGEFLAGADGIVSLTHAGMRQLERWEAARTATHNRQVIPCSVDFRLFDLPTPEQRTAARADLGLQSDAFLLAYLGSLGTWYMLDEMLDLFTVVKLARPQSRFLFVTPDDSDQVYAAAARRGIAREDVVIRSATRQQVRFYLSAADLGVFFIRPSPSKVSSSPTKLGEYLAMGIPVLTNAGVGDVAEIIERTRGGVVVDDFTPESYRRVLGGLDALLLSRPAEIRSNARLIYDLDTAVESYARLYAGALPPGAPETRADGLPDSVDSGKFEA
jgi:glycosyltransferase involved in cell wall biosynthesis